MSARVLDSSDERRTLVLVVALRVLRDPVLALDASNEALATRSAGADDVAALECLARLEREAPTIQALGSIASSGLVVALETEAADRDGD